MAGVWMACSPLVLPSYDAVAPLGVWASHANGVVLLALGSIALTRPRRWLDWASLGVAGWLIAAPLALGLANSAAATSNHMLVGIAIGITALAWIAQHREDGEAAHIEPH